MKVYYMSGASSLMQVIDVLGDYRYIMFFFKFGNHSVSIVWLYLRQLLTPKIIEVKTPLRIIVESFCTRQICPFIIGPQTVLTTESAQSAFNTYTSSSQKHDVLPCHICSVLKNIFVDINSRLESMIKCKYTKSF